MTFLTLVLFRLDVELPALHHRRALDRLPRGAIDATEDYVDLILLGELPRFGFRDAIRRCTVLEIQVYLPPNSPPLALMSLITILATFALAIPKNESGPVWSVMTPTLMDRLSEVVDSVMAVLLS
jgi:hypothetical protein